MQYFQFSPPPFLCPDFPHPRPKYCNCFLLLIQGMGIATKTWSVAKTNYSYSDSTQINQCDILENNVVTDAVSQIALSDHSDDVQRQNIVNSMKYGTVTG